MRLALVDLFKNFKRASCSSPWDNFSLCYFFFPVYTGYQSSSSVGCIDISRILEFMKHKAWTFLQENDI